MDSSTSDADGGAGGTGRGVRRAALVALVLGVAQGWSAPALGQPGASAQAEVLFSEGKGLLDAERYDEACPKLDASQRLDPATGTLLALAYCQEQRGFTASAWVAYREAAGRAKAEGRMDRYEAAVARAAALEGRLSRIRVDVPSEIAALAGLEVRRGDQLVDRAAWGMPLPVDPGAHEIHVVARGKQPWSKTVTVGKEGDLQAVVVPALEDAEVAVAPTPVVAPLPERDRVADTGAEEGNPYRTVSYVIGGVGVVALGVGTYFGLQAMSKKSDSDAYCEGNRCKPQGESLRNDAIDAAAWSTIGIGAGGVLLAGAVVMYAVSGDPSREQATVHTAPFVGAGTVGWSAGGTF
jgi:hypothetical protein